MDPITFGAVFVGATGGTLVIIHALGQSGFPINETAIKIVLEITKSGAILWFLNHIYKLFL